MKPWLARKTDSNKKSIPKCIACDVTFMDKKSTLIAHSITEEHKTAQLNFQSKGRQQIELSNFIDDPITQNVRSLQLRICLLIAGKNLQICLGDDILVVFKREIPGHPVINRVSIGGTKTANLIREGIRSFFFLRKHK